MNEPSPPNVSDPSISAESAPVVTESGLLRALGPWTAASVVVGSIIGSGVFRKPQIIAESTPDFATAISVWVVGGVLTMMATLALAEVSVLFPKVGGPYVVLREGFGRWAGFLWGWVEFGIIRAAAVAALSAMFTDALFSLLNTVFDYSPANEWVKPSTTVSAILILAAVNVRGVLVSGALQLGLTVVKVATVASLIALPILVALFGPAGSLHVEEIAQPHAAGAAFSWSGYGTALVAVLWAYHGWLTLAPVAEEVKDPQRNLPIALLGTSRLKGVFMML
ncbi:MAG: amino acid permease [Planctomycetia bacterium]